jgi:hypothetical protein
MGRWVRFEQQLSTGFGMLEGDRITVYLGDMYGNATATQEVLLTDSVDLLIPCQPTKMIGLANNSRSIAEQNGTATPNYSHYFLKPSNTFLANGKII